MRKQITLSIGALALALGFSAAGMAQAPGSVPAPEGWKRCPRCQNNADRAAANKEYKVEGRAFNPRDLTGVWGFGGIGGTFRNPPPMTDYGKQLFAETLGSKNDAGEWLHDKDTSRDGAGAKINCDPRGWPRLHTYNYGFEFLMLPDRVLQFFEITHTWRTIWIDGRKLPESVPEPRWMGWSVGRWEGDTFVVESTGFDERSWLGNADPAGGYPHSDEMKVVERWRRLNFATIEHQITVIDPKVYTQPWVTAATTTILQPAAELGENYCVPSDYTDFTNDVFLPAAGAGARKQ
jgi:hypothetical protein